MDWDRTRVWSEGGYYARVFMNVRGREPRGVIDPQDYERVRDEIKERLEATVDPQGNSLGTLVFRPEEVYRNVRNVAPGPDRPFRGAGLAVDRRRGLSDDPCAGE